MKDFTRLRQLMDAMEEVLRHPRTNDNNIRRKFNEECVARGMMGKSFVNSWGIYFANIERSFYRNNRTFENDYYKRFAEIHSELIRNYRTSFRLPSRSKHAKRAHQNTHAKKDVINGRKRNRTASPDQAIVEHVVDSSDVGGPPANISSDMEGVDPSVEGNIEDVDQINGDASSSQSMESGNQESEKDVGSESVGGGFNNTSLSVIEVSTVVSRFLSSVQENISSRFALGSNLENSGRGNEAANAPEHSGNIHVSQKVEDGEESQNDANLGNTLNHSSQMPEPRSVPSEPVSTSPVHPLQQSQRSNITLQQPNVQQLQYTSENNLYKYLNNQMNTIGSILSTALQNVAKEQLETLKYRNMNVMPKKDTEKTEQ